MLTCMYTYKGAHTHRGMYTHEEIYKEKCTCDYEQDKHIHMYKGSEALTDNTQIDTYKKCYNQEVDQHTYMTLHMQGYNSSPPQSWTPLFSSLA